MTITIKGKNREPAAQKRLLDAALELFTRKGYAATSVREIVETAGVTKPVLYYYYGSKEGIYLSLFREPFALFDEFIELYQGDTGLCAAEALAELCDRVFRLFVDNLDTARLMYSIYYGPPQGAPFFDFDGYHQKLFEKTKTLVQQGIRSGEFVEADASDMTWLIIGALNVAMEEQLCHAEPRIDGQALNRILSLAFRNLTGSYSRQSGQLRDTEF